MLFRKNFIPLKESYAIDESNSNVLYKDAERMLLEELGLQSDVRKLKLGEAVYLCDYLSRNSRASLDSRDIELIAQKGYGWREESSASRYYPEKSVYMDAITRLSEIYDNLLKERERLNGREI